MVRKIINFFKPNKKKEFEKYLSIQGWLTPIEAKGLFKIAFCLPVNAVVLEIGSWKGKSTWCISQGLKKGIINCIDPFDAAGEDGSKEIYNDTKGEIDLLDQFKNNLLKAASNVKIKILKGYSNDFVGAVKNIDFLFIDGDHSIEGCRFDFDNFENDLKRGGYLAFHDYYPERKDLGSTWVIDNLVTKSTKYKFYKTYDSLCVFKKI